MLTLRTIALAVLFGLPIMTFAAGPATQPDPQTAESFTHTLELNYLLYLPPGYEGAADRKWPLVLFLHGSGERGTNLHLVEKWGPPKRVADGERFPFILVSPQCPVNQRWDVLELMLLIENTQANYRVDADRIYVTGLSMGGLGTWDLAERYPAKFAAIAPVCGAGNPTAVKMFEQIAKLPVWDFHGENDPVVPIARSEEMVKALQDAGDPEVKFTRYPHTGHDSWIQAYNDPELYKWLLSHKRQPTTRPER